MDVYPIYFRFVLNIKPVLKYFFYIFICLGVTPVWADGGIVFVENKGQWPVQVLYRADIPGGFLYVEKNSLFFHLIDGEAIHAIHDHPTYKKPIQNHTYRIVFEGANLNSKTSGDMQVTTLFNYFQGNDSRKWASNARGFEKLFIRDLYPKVDLEIFGGASGIKYNLIVKDGRPEKIKMRYEGVDGMEVIGKVLHIRTSLGDIQENIPLVYAQGNDTIVNLGSQYKLENNTVTFDIEKTSRRLKRLVIDPVMVFSTFSGSPADNFGFTGTYDNNGNAYSGGAVYESGYPVTTGAFQNFWAGGIDVDFVGNLARDMGIYKTSPDGKNKLFMTYIGGPHNEQPHSMVINSKGELCILGATYSKDFPMVGNTFDQLFNGSTDIVVLKLSGDGSALNASTFLGGDGFDGMNGQYSEPGEPSTSPIAWNYGDQYRGEIIVDAFDNIYIASCTRSSQFSFPITNGIQKIFGGQQDGCVFKLTDNLSNITWMTYLGNTGWDAALGLQLDSKNNLYVCGGTTAGLMMKGQAGKNADYMGGRSDGFLVKINSTGTTITNYTYLGTNDYDNAFFIQIDKFDNPYVTGQTKGVWPVVGNVYTTPNGGQFIVKLKQDLSDYTLSMVYGNGLSKPQISPTAFLVDECERIFVSGWGGEVNSEPSFLGGNTYRMPVTPDAWQGNTDGSDFYLSIFSKNLEELVYATFFGGGIRDGEVGEHVDGGTSRFDRKGIVYQSVCGGCGGGTPETPTTSGVFGPVNLARNNRCNNLIFKLDFENLNKAPRIKDTLITVTTFDTLNYDFEVTDADKYDSLFTGSKAARYNSPEGPLVPDGPDFHLPKLGTNNISGRLKWIPNCTHANKDTLYIPVTAVDNGCPAVKSDTAMIRIVVVPPPLYKAPGLVCLIHVNENTLKIQFSEYSDTGRYFKEFVLVKRMPNGSESVIKRFPKGAVPEYDDLAAFQHQTQNYCYYLYALNVCDKADDSTYVICSVEEATVPIQETRIFHATVADDDKSVQVRWFKIFEDDFGAYEIYRKPRNTVKGFELVGMVTDGDDTLYEDFDLDPEVESYCYEVKVADKCGHKSLASNSACNVVLKGLSIPFEHDLQWQQYEEWPAGVREYEISRKDDRNIPMTIFITPVNDHKDTALDYNWGAYRYRVIAREEGGDNAWSQSNDIYLIQKPIVYVPNAFTPNGDLLNDIWGIKHAFVKDFQLTVYNRWGQKVFETSDKNEIYEGIFKSITPSDNVFIWTIRYTGWDKSIHFEKGNVTILN